MTAYKALRKCVQNVATGKRQNVRFTNTQISGSQAVFVVVILNQSTSTNLGQNSSY
jgi:hypothetical protein